MSNSVCPPLSPDVCGRKTWPKSIRVGHATVKVYRNAHPGTASGWIYVVAWNTPRGRLREKFAEEAEAVSEARTKAAQLAAGRIEGAEMSSGDRDELTAARRIVGSVPLLSALEEWSKARELTAGSVLSAARAWAARNGQVHSRIKVAAVVANYLAAKTAAGKNVASDHASIFENIRRDFGEIYLDTLTARQLDGWLSKRSHPVSRNTYRKRIVALCRWAQRKGYLPRDARTEAEMTERAHEPPPDIGIITVATWRTLLAHFAANHRELLAPLVLAGFCGLRRKEVHEQTWEDIILERRSLRVTIGKRGTPARRLVPLCPAAVEWLMLCGNRTGKICESLAIDGIRRIARDAALPELPDNCFRHSYISHAVASTGDIPRVSLNAGNSPKEINRHYRELVAEEEGNAWFESLPNSTDDFMTPAEMAR